MKDPRIAKLASNLLNHSCKLKKGQTIIIDASEQSKDLVVELVRQVYKIGAYPFVRLSNEQVSREVLMGMTEEQSKQMLKYQKPMFEDSDAYIAICASNNAFENSDVPAEIKNSHTKHFGKPITDIRCKKNWVLLHWPNASLAQLAQTSLESFEDFYFDVCTMDYAKMAKAMEPLKNLMERTDKVRIVAPDTDLTFSLKGQKAVICSGSHNIPDGEVFSSPVRDSVSGKIRFDIPSLCKGVLHHDVTLTFKDGKVIEATSSNSAALNSELDSDEGARYTGEFAFGVNPYITKPMNDTLFDEKISGTIHIALGNSYEDAFNGNKSQVHWDIILTGGEIYFDDILIRKDGKFVTKELLGLNPDKLK